MRRNEYNLSFIHPPAWLRDLTTRGNEPGGDFFFWWGTVQELISSPRRVRLSWAPPNVNSRCFEVMK